MHKTLQNLGLCKRANKLVSGEAMVLDQIKSQKATLVFLASDAGPNTSKRIRDKATYYHVPLFDQFTTEELSNAIGKTNRKAIAIIDQAFAKLLKKDIKER